MFHSNCISELMLESLTQLQGSSFCGLLHSCLRRLNNGLILQMIPPTILLNEHEKTLIECCVSYLKGFKVNMKCERYRFKIKFLLMICFQGQRMKVGKKATKHREWV